jgi:Gram-negative porin
MGSLHKQPTMSRRQTMTNKPVLTLMAALTALLAGSQANAQSSVSISGMLDIGLYRAFDKSRNVGTMQRSHIAFTGSEATRARLRRWWRIRRTAAATGALAPPP